MTRTLWPLAAVGLLLLPDPARACAVCQSAQDAETQTAFLFATLFMTLLPLSLIGASALWLRRRLRQMRADE